MNYTKLFAILAVLAIITAVLLFFTKNRSDNPGPANRDNLGNVQSPGLESKIDEQGEVAVEVIPEDVSSGAQIWKFQVAMNTHSVELDADMAKVSALVDASGREYQPISWAGAPSGGHHRSGTLSFAPISPMPQSLEIRIRGVGGIASRSFKWQLSN